jgi:hypothetical protein
MAVEIPEWVVSDDVARSLVPEQGFFRDYFDYASSMTDAPLIYHVGTCLQLLSACLANTDIRVMWKDGRHYDVRTPLWAVLVGRSNHRKSYAANLGMGLFRRARAHTEEKTCLIPADGSLEAWHDLMAGDPEADPPLLPAPNIVLFRDEMRSLLSQAKRGYSEGMKPWMLELHTGEDRERVTKSGGLRLVKRPRLGVFGTIQPEVFNSDTGAMDWHLGWLARFVFFPGHRIRFDDACTDAKRDGQLMNWIRRVVLPCRGQIVIPHGMGRPISRWAQSEVDDKADEYPDGLVSHLGRYPHLGFVAAACYAASEKTHAQPDKHGSFGVREDHVKLALKLMCVLKDAAIPLFRMTQRTAEGRTEDVVLATIRRSEEPVTVSELDKLIPDLSIRQIQRITEVLFKEKVVRRRIRNDPGRKGPKPLEYWV